jgi:DNA replication protein DnaC
MNSTVEIKGKITEYLKTLRLPGIRRNYEAEAKEAAMKDISYEAYLYSLLTHEMEMRNENRKKDRIKYAEFPYKKYFEELKPEYLPEDAMKKLKMLKSLDFIKEGRNLIMSGSPGTGKTHIAIALGIEACLQNFKVLFITVPALVTQLKESRSQKLLRSYQSKFERYDLVICDEFGYISFDKEGSELLFSSLSLRTGRKATIITTNLSFERWDELFKDPVLTAAMVDRLTHKAVFVNMNGSSYRMRETKDCIKSG